MKKLTKLLSAMLAVMMIASSLGMVAFAENADVTITFAKNAVETTTYPISNIEPSTPSKQYSIEGMYIGNELVFNFNTAMNKDTLNPETVKIFLAEKDGLSGTAYADRVITTTDGKTEWKYTRYAATETTYTIYLSEMCEGIMTHTVTFTSGVQTADNVPINEVNKTFKTGRIAADVDAAEGKHLVDVAFGKSFVGDNNTERTEWTEQQDNFNVGGRKQLETNVAYRIDLGNYYDIADIKITGAADVDWAWGNTILAAYSNDPDATFATAVSMGEFDKDRLTKATGSNAVQGGRGAVRYLNLSAPVRARYIFLKCTTKKSGYSDMAADIKILASVDTDYGKMTATNDGTNYTVTVPAKQYVAGSAEGGYMIIAGYDVNGLITNIKCDTAAYENDAVSMTANMPANTVNVKAALIKSFDSPYLLTDALELPIAE